MSERLTKVKIVDHRGRTKASFTWSQGEWFWFEGLRPPSKAAQRAIEAKYGTTWQKYTAAPDPALRAAAEAALLDEKANALAALFDGMDQTDSHHHHPRLDVPGLSVRMEKVIPVLDALANELPGPSLTLTIDELRRHIERFVD